MNLMVSIFIHRGKCSSIRVVSAQCLHDLNSALVQTLKDDFEEELVFKGEDNWGERNVLRDVGTGKINYVTHSSRLYFSSSLLYQSSTLV